MSSRKDLLGSVKFRRRSRFGTVGEEGGFRDVDSGDLQLEMPGRGLGGRSGLVMKTGLPSVKGRLKHGRRADPAKRGWEQKGLRTHR